MSKKLQNQISKKLEKLSKLLDKIAEAHAINSDDPVYNLAEDLKETRQLLEDQTSKQLDNFGEPIILETGICSLLDDWESQKAAK